MVLVHPEGFCRYPGSPEKICKPNFKETVPENFPAGFRDLALRFPIIFRCSEFIAGVISIRLSAKRRCRLRRPTLTFTLSISAPLPREHKEINDFYMMDINEPLEALRSNVKYPSLMLTSLSGNFEASNLDNILDLINAVS